MTATEDRMREAFDSEHDDGRTLVQIAASVADLMVDEATAALRKQHAEMLAVLRDLANATAGYLYGKPEQALIDRANQLLDAADSAAAEASGTGG